MKKYLWIIVYVLIITVFAACGKAKVLKTGDSFTITGVVAYSDEPSDIGTEYCSVTCDKKIEYIYIDVYEEESQWSSNEFFTKVDNDTALLKGYVGKKITVSGEFDAECHGIPYITNIDILE